MRLKVVNLNTWIGGQHTWDNIASYLSAESPDVIFLQEVVESGGLLSKHYFNTSSSLKKLLDYPYADFEPQFVVRNKYTDGEFLPMGVSILSKFPLKNRKAFWFEGDHASKVDLLGDFDISNFPRCLLHCELEVGGSLCNVISLQGVWAKTHTETPKQLNMSEKIKDYIKDLPNVIMTGDFNVNEGTQSIQNIEGILVNIFKGERISSFNMKHKSNPGFASAIVDFIFSSPNLKVVEHYTSSCDVSDHQSQVVVFEL